MENPTILCTIPLAIVGGLIFIAAAVCILSALRLFGIISQDERRQGKDV